MATPREIFDRDSSKNLTVHVIQEIQLSTGASLSITAKVSFDFDAGVRFVYLYLGDTPLATNVIRYYLAQPTEALKIAGTLQTDMGFAGTSERIKSADLKFSGRIFFYTSSTISAEDRSSLEAEAAQMGVGLIIRDKPYLDQRIVLEHPMAFISHDSRDKDSFVRKLVEGMQKRVCTVWYDEYSLIPGKSLRESIEDGLKKCKKCVLILSPNFLSNTGWSKKEFDSVFTRELLEKKNVIIPVWYGVTKQQVYDYSLSLPDRVAVVCSPSAPNIEEVARRLVTAINTD